MKQIPLVKVSGHGLRLKSQSQTGVELTAKLCGAIRSFVGQDELNVGIVWIDGAANVVADITRPSECILVEVTLNDVGNNRFPPRVEQMVADLVAVFPGHNVVVQILD